MYTAWGLPRVAPSALGNHQPEFPVRTYVVQRGDTFLGIARRFRSPAQLIVQYNQGAPTMMYKGMRILDIHEKQRLTIPTVPVPSGYAWNDATASFVRVGRVGEPPADDCPVGAARDPIFHVCLPTGGAGNTACPPGLVFDPPQQICVWPQDVTQTCPVQGMTKDTNGVCQCPTGRTFDPNGDGGAGCYYCVTGATYNTATHGCECDAGLIYQKSTDSCVAPSTPVALPCPVANMTKDANGVCQCPTGRTFDPNGDGGAGCYYCVTGATYNTATHGCECDAGLIYQKSTDSCVKPVVCGPGTTDDGKQGCRPVVASDCAAGETFDPNGKGGYRCFACVGKGSVYDLATHDCICAPGSGWSAKDNACVQGSTPKPPPPPPPCDQGKTRTPVELIQDGVTYAPGDCVPPPKPPVKGGDQAAAAPKSNTALIVALALAGTAGAIGIGYALNKNKKKRAS
jgi:hypothetical protein